MSKICQIIIIVTILYSSQVHAGIIFPKFERSGNFSDEPSSEEDSSHEDSKESVENSTSFRNFEGKAHHVKDKAGGTLIIEGLDSFIFIPKKYDSRIDDESEKESNQVSSSSARPPFMVTTLNSLGRPPPTITASTTQERQPPIITSSRPFKRPPPTITASTSRLSRPTITQKKEGPKHEVKGDSSLSNGTNCDNPCSPHGFLTFLGIVPAGCQPAELGRPIGSPSSGEIDEPIGESDEYNEPQDEDSDPLDQTVQPDFTVQPEQTVQTVQTAQPSDESDELPDDSDELSTQPVETEEPSDESTEPPDEPEKPPSETSKPPDESDLQPDEQDWNEKHCSPPKKHKNPKAPRTLPISPLLPMSSAQLKLSMPSGNSLSKIDPWDEYDRLKPKNQDVVDTLWDMEYALSTTINYEVDENVLRKIYQQYVNRNMTTKVFDRKKGTQN